MTSLRDLFKKSKKAYPKIKKKAQETTDKILDADLEETATKVVEATGKTTKKATIGLGKLILWGGFITINLFVLYVVFTMIYHPIWCNNKYAEVFEERKVFKSLNERELIKLRDQWISKGCHYTVNPLCYYDAEAKELSGTRQYQLWSQTFRYQLQKY